MLIKALTRDNAMFRVANPGDTLATQESPFAITTVGNGTLAAASLLASIINRTGPTAAYTDTTDTAANLMLALSIPVSPVGLVTTASPLVQVGDTWRLRYVNTVAFAATIAGGTGVTVTYPTVNASSVKDFLLTCTAGGEQTTATVSQTNGSAVLTGMSLQQTQLLSINQTVTGSGLSGIIISIQQGVGCTLSAAATSTLAINAATFSPSFTMAGIGQSLL